MPSALSIIYFTIAILFLSSSAFAQRLSITMGQIDSLHMPYSLPELARIYQERKLENDPDVAKRIWDITKNYHALRTARKELGILSVQAGNLKAAWQLKGALAAKGDITDLEELAAHNAYLSRKLALIAKEHQARNCLLEIVRLSLLNIVTEKGTGNEQKEKKHTAPD